MNRKQLGVVYTISNGCYNNKCLKAFWIIIVVKNATM